MKFKKVVSVILAAVFVLSAGITENTNQKSALAAESKSRVSVHDPSVFKDEQTGTYYVFGSHIEAAKSADLQNWTSFANGYAKNNNVLFGDLSQNLKGAFDWAGEDLEDCVGGYAVWAPDVIYNPDYINKDGSKGAYLMYFCTSSTYMRSVIAFAASKSAEGPYEFVDTLIYSGFTENDSYATSTTKNVNRKYTSTNIDELIAAGEVTYNSDWFSSSNYNNYLYPNAIDPTIYYDTDGKMYMCYGSWSGGIFTLEMNPETGRCIHPKTGKTADGRMVDSYFGTKISGGYYKSGEGPFIEYNSDTGYYYLWTTYGGLFSDGGYNMRVFRSDNPLGPFYDAAGKPAVLEASMSLDSVGLKVMGNHKFSSLSTAYMACGHNSVLKDDDGQWYLFNHVRFNDGTEYHEVRVHSMYFNSEGWPVVAPYEYSGDKMSETGYNTNDITGEYEFINHGNDTSSAIHEYSLITLNEDGTVSGSASGTWSQADDSSAAEITISGQKYYGYFMEIHDESGTDKKVMAFSAVGSNNQTVWGVKNTAAGSDIEREKVIDYTNKNSSIVYNAESAEDSSSEVYIGDTELLNGVSYYVANKNSGMVLELADGKTSNGTNIHQWSKLGGKQQEWKFVALDNGYCKIVSMADERKCITVSENSAENGVNIELSDYVGSDAQQWKFIKNGSFYGIVSKCSADTAGMDIYDWSVENGGNLNQWNYWGGDCQLWSVTPVYPAVNDGIYTLKNINSGKWISAESSGNVVQSSKPEGWSIKSIDDNYYVILNEHGKSLTVESGNGDNGKNIYISEYTGAESQKFNIICNKDGSYSVMTAVSDNKSSLDVYEVSKEDGANICQWEFWAGEGQKFIIEPVNTEKAVSGDVNADGAFDISDAVTLQKYILGKGSLVNFSNGDMNNDNIIDIFDVTAMKKLLK